MLDRYLSETQQLLQNPQAPSSLYSESDLTSYINRARGQVAGESEAIRKIGTIDTVVDQRPYDFSSIDLGVKATTGIEGAINIRRIAYAVGTGQRWMTPRNWEWFDIYCLNTPVPTAGIPKTWAQYGQGAAPGDSGSGAGGSFYIDPPPDIVYTLSCDCVCWPQDLAEDVDVEAIPFLWTAAVPYFAAYLALLSAQANARMADAERYFNLYTMFMNRARQFSNPSVLRTQYAQSVDPTQLNKLGLRPSAPQGQNNDGGGQQ